MVQKWVQHIGFVKEMLGSIPWGISLSDKFDDLVMYLPVRLLCWTILSYLWLRGTCFVMLSCFQHHSFFNCFHVLSWYSLSNKGQLGFCQTFLEGFKKHSSFTFSLPNLPCYRIYNIMSFEGAMDSKTFHLVFLR